MRILLAIDVYHCVSAYIAGQPGQASARSSINARRREAARLRAGLAFQLYGSKVKGPGRTAPISFARRCCGSHGRGLGPREELDGHPKDLTQAQVLDRHVIHSTPRSNFGNRNTNQRHNVLTGNADAGKMSSTARTCSSYSPTGDLRASERRLTPINRATRSSHRRPRRQDHEGDVTVGGKASTERW